MSFAQWTDQLRIASFRGIPFGVREGESAFGRRSSIHEYPFRDKPWIEDLGRSTRRISFRGFLLENDATYNGGAVLQQKERLIAAYEQPGSATLVHPSLGRLTVSAVDSGLRFRDGIEGRYYAFDMAIIESGERIFPTQLLATSDAVMQASLNADASASGNFISRATNDLKQGAAVVGQAVGTAAQWARLAQSLGNDATNLTGLVSTLKGNFGRYFGGRNYGGFTGITSATQQSAQTVESLIAQGTVSRNQINLAAGGLNSAAAGLGL